MRQFSATEFPFVVLMDSQGLIAWSGHPDNRDLVLDLSELREGRTLIDIEDWIDDPEEPKLDDAEWSNNTRPAKKQKSLSDTFKEQQEKFQLFVQIISDKPAKSDDVSDSGTYLDYLDMLRKAAEPLKRAYVVLQTELEADLEQEIIENPRHKKENQNQWQFPEKEGSYTLKVVLHTVFFGAHEDIANMEKVLGKFKSEVRN